MRALGLPGRMVRGMVPIGTAAGIAARFPGRTLCFEVRRDLLVRRFTPFAEMATDPDAVDRMAAPIASALRTG